MTRDEFQQCLDEAAENGAERALRKVGLHDDDAHADIQTLRDLLNWLRDMRNSTAKGLVLFFVKLILLFAMLGFAVKSGVWKAIFAVK
jgi:hypothetical protein